MSEWKKTKYPGVRFREHETRKHGISKDRYFVIRYQRDGKRHEEGTGWASEGWTAEKAGNELAELKKAYTLGNGSPTRLTEKRELVKIQEEHKQREEERQENGCLDMRIDASHPSLRPATVVRIRDPVEEGLLFDVIKAYFQGIKAAE